MRTGEFLHLAAVGVGNAVYNAGLSLREAARLGSRGWWWRLRLAMASEWALDSPFRVARREGAEAGLSEEDAVYGETPALTAFALLRDLEVGPEDRVVDLGCGRGTVPLVAALAFGARAVGLDLLPTFAEKGRRVAERLGLGDRVRFRRADIRSDALPKGTVYFVAGTSLEADSWRRVASRLSRVPPGTRALSLSAPLPEAHWEVLRRETRPFSWGAATVYVQRRRRSTPAGGRRRGGARGPGRARPDRGPPGSTRCGR